MPFIFVEIGLYTKTLMHSGARADENLLPKSNIVLKKYATVVCVGSLKDFKN
jgi:hypothetical protein